MKSRLLVWIFRKQESKRIRVQIIQNTFIDSLIEFCALASQTISFTGIDDPQTWPYIYCAIGLQAKGVGTIVDILTDFYTIVLHSICLVQVFSFNKQILAFVIFHSIGIGKIRYRWIRIQLEF